MSDERESGQTVYVEAEWLGKGEVYLSGQTIYCEDYLIQDEPVDADPLLAAIGEVLALQERDAGPSDDSSWDHGYDAALAEVAAIIAEHVPAATKES